jgi:hypothetical protein
MTDQLTRRLHAAADGVMPRLRPSADVRAHAEQGRRRRRLAATALVGLVGAGVVAGLWRSPEPNTPPVQERREGIHQLLSEEEVPYLADDVRVIDREVARPVSSCQRASLVELGATRAVQRTFKPDGEDWPPVRAHHAVARFHSERAAADAYGKLESWLRSCRSDKGQSRILPTQRGFDGRADVVEVRRREPGYADEYEAEATINAIRGRSISVVTLAWPPKGWGPMDDTLSQTAHLVLARLAGVRTSSAAAIPASFRFAEPPLPGKYRGDRSIRTPWLTASCRPPKPQASDTSRLAMLTVRNHAQPFPGLRQLAVYPDEATAAAVAQDLRDKITDCGRAVELAPQGDGSYGLARSGSTAAEPGAVHLGVRPRSDKPKAALVEAVAQWGNAVFVAHEGFHEGISEANAIELIAWSAEHNRPLICAIATDCG